MISSGLVAKQTVTAAAVVLISADDVATARFRHVYITNESAVPGFFSLDGGETVVRLPASTWMTLDNVSITGAVVAIREGTDDLKGCTQRSGNMSGGSAQAVGIFRTTVQGSVSVAITTTEIRAENVSRAALYLTNIGNRDVWIGIGGPAVVGEGIKIDKNGGQFTFDSGGFSVAAINGIADLVASTVAFTEGIK